MYLKRLLIYSCLIIGIQAFCNSNDSSKHVQIVFENLLMSNSNITGLEKVINSKSGSEYEKLLFILMKNSMNNLVLKNDYQSVLKSKIHKEEKKLIEEILNDNDINKITRRLKLMAKAKGTKKNINYTEQEAENISRNILKNINYDDNDYNSKQIEKKLKYTLEDSINPLSVKNINDDINIDVLKKEIFYKIYENFIRTILESKHIFSIKHLDYQTKDDPIIFNIKGLEDLKVHKNKIIKFSKDGYFNKDQVLKITNIDGLEKMVDIDVILGHNIKDPQIYFSFISQLTSDLDLKNNIKYLYLTKLYSEIDQNHIDESLKKIRNEISILKYLTYNGTNLERLKLNLKALSKILKVENKKERLDILNHFNRLEDLYGDLFSNFKKDYQFLLQYKQRKINKTRSNNLTSTNLNYEKLIDSDNKFKYTDVLPKDKKKLLERLMSTKKFNLSSIDNNLIELQEDHTLKIAKNQIQGIKGPNTVESLEEFIPVREQDFSYLSIPTPQNKKLTDIELTTSTGRKINNFRIMVDPRNNSYFLKITGLESNESLHFKAHFSSMKLKKMIRSGKQAKIYIDKSRFKSFIKKELPDNLVYLKKVILSAIDEKDDFMLFDIINAIRLSSVYADEIHEESYLNIDIEKVSMKRLSDFARYINDEHLLEFQCSSATSLTYTILKSYFKDNKNIKIYPNYSYTGSMSYQHLSLMVEYKNKLFTYDPTPSSEDLGHPTFMKQRISLLEENKDYLQNQRLQKNLLLQKDDFHKIKSFFKETKNKLFKSSKLKKAIQSKNVKGPLSRVYKFVSIVNNYLNTNEPGIDRLFVLYPNADKSLKLEETLLEIISHERSLLTKSLENSNLRIKHPAYQDQGLVFEIDGILSDLQTQLSSYNKLLDCNRLLKKFD